MDEIWKGSEVKLAIIREYSAYTKILEKRRRHTYSLIEMAFRRTSTPLAVRASHLAPRSRAPPVSGVQYGMPPIPLQVESQGKGCRLIQAGRCEDMWVVEKIEVSGGFLPGLSVNIPLGLTCIIGPRGSGKSTLAEAVRFAICGISAAPKQSVDLIQANLAGGAIVTITALADSSNRYTIKRGLKQ